MDHPQTPNLPAALCPRCGYDLRGTAFAWVEACPLEGTCPDCGHAFAWSSVFRRPRHPHLIEHQWTRPISFSLLCRRTLARFPRRPAPTDTAQRWRRRSLLTLPYSLLWTMGGTLLPWRFWRSVRLEHPLSLPLVAALVLLAALVCVTFVWAAALSAGTIDWLTVGVAQAEVWDLPGGAARVTRWSADRFASDRLSVLICPLLVPLTMPLLFLTLPASHLRFGHMLRVALYSAIALLLLLVLLTYLCAVLDVLRDLRLVPVAARETVEYVLRVGPPWSNGFLQRARGLSTTSAAIDFLVIWPLLAWWWRCACKHYLRLENPGAIAGLLTFLAVLASLLVQLYFVDGWLRYWY